MRGVPRCSFDSARGRRGGIIPRRERPAPTVRSAARLAGIRLAPGFLPRHLVSYLYAAFVTIGLLAFVSFMQA